MQEPFDESLSVRESQEIVQAIREGEAEIEVGGGKPVDEAFTDIPSKLGWTE